MRKINDKTSIINEIESNGNLYNSNTDIANCFNDFFTSIAHNITESINTSDKSHEEFIRETNTQFKLDMIYPIDIIHIASDLQNKNSPDTHGISNSLLKNIIDCIALPLTHIFNLSFQTGFIPHQLKIAKVIPIFKLKTKSNSETLKMSNY